MSRPIDTAGQTAPSKRDVIRATREITRRGILSARALKDNDARYLELGRRWQVVHEAASAYGYAQLDFAPTPYEVDQAYVVMDWLGFVKRGEGRDAMLRIIAWAIGTAAWAMAKREQVSEKTIERRIDRSMVTIANAFFGTGFKIIVVDEPYKSTPFAMMCEGAKPLYADKVVIDTVYVYGKGLMRNGRRWNDGRAKAERFV